MTKPYEDAFPRREGWIERGLTKREYFAAMAMQGLLPNYRTERSQEGDEALAYLAVKQADALLAELDK